MSESLIQDTTQKKTRRRLRISGIVQGVGFRPYVYRLAREMHLSGSVNNDPAGVTIEVEGERSRLEFFESRLKPEAPASARIDDIQFQNCEVKNDSDFVIGPSQSGVKPTAHISSDLALCDNCLNEMRDPANRRFRYPFINCTDCGPRYTIIDRLPYDRPSTSMAGFQMCHLCQAEYDDPADRRFHAQPNGCRDCGPQLTCFDRNWVEIADDPIDATKDALKQGEVVAVRGLGGYHLAVDAFNRDAIEQLRQHKGRIEKPFALMASNVEQVLKHCYLNSEERQLLGSNSAPIVLLDKRAESDLPDLIAPGQSRLGVMLPYTPLHHLLFEGCFDLLVMTSANISEEPIVIGNDEARVRLGHLADCFLTHNREILHRCDDSVIQVVDHQKRTIRRSRGFVPEAVPVPTMLAKPILACGGELKNSLALGRDNNIFLSQHIGNLDNLSAFDFFKHCIDHLKRLFEIEPELIACDLHPDYLHSKWARGQSAVPVVEVQHHHAHLVSVMTENNVTDPTIGLILDGTGYGLDGTIWGGEILEGDASGFKRLNWLEMVPMPGGAASINEPWRMAVSWLWHVYQEKLFDHKLPCLKNQKRSNIELLLDSMEKGVNVPLTSSCGRLYDAVAAIVGLGQTVSYEAQAAMALEAIADRSITDTYHDAYAIDSSGPIVVAPLVRAVVEDYISGISPAVISAKFHNSLAEMLVALATCARQRSGINQVGLSGGVWQNALLFERVTDQLRKLEFDVLTHSVVPTNDGGLALGQAVIADAASRKKELI